MWTQNYNPLGDVAFSTAVAALPAVILLGSIMIFRMRVHLAAGLGWAAAMCVALGVYRMSFDKAAASSVMGAAFGLFPIGWILLNVIFVYQLTVKKGLFDVLRRSLETIAPDARIQVVLIAFAFGAFLEGIAGFGAPVAITATILAQLGTPPLQACVLTLIANTAPVAFGTIGIPITTLAQVTGLEPRLLSAMAGGQLALFSMLIPCWVVVALAGWHGLRGVWPVALTAGLAFTVPEYLLSVYHGPWLVGPVSGLCAVLGLLALLRCWQPTFPWRFAEDGSLGPTATGMPGQNSGAVFSRSQMAQAWAPWVIVTVFILAWGTPHFAVWLDRLAGWKLSVPHLDQLVQRVAPVVPSNAAPEKAIFKLNILSATGTGILLAALLAGSAMRVSWREMARVYGETFWRIRLSLLTIAAMLALGTLTRFSGSDATLGLALARTGSLYPFFGTLLGWLGVAFTGSDTSSNVLFGSLQVVTAQQIGVSPVLMASANSTGGVMGKMMSPQSIVIATTATNAYGNEGNILRRTLPHSIALVVIMGILVYCQAYVAPFTKMVPP